jgi:MFS family permease
MPPAGDVVADDEAIWVPVTINLPLGLTKSFTPDNCAPLSLLFGPFSIIMLAQTGNTVLVPVLPFLVKDVGATAVAYGLLQSTLWTSQTVLAPVLGWASDRIGRRPVILLSLLVSAAGNALLAVSTSVSMMFAARIVSGLGFQIALFRAYFADSAPKKEKAGKFGLIGVIQSFSLFAGPTIGGLVAKSFGRRAATWLSAALFVLAAFIAFVWSPDEKKAEVNVELGKAPTDDKHKTVGGVEMVKIDLTETRRSRDSAEAADSCCGSLSEYPLCRKAGKMWKFALWLAGYDLYPLLSLNFFFRFAFAAYKSIFAFFCMAMLGFGTAQVGYALSAMGHLFTLLPSPDTF